MTINVPQPSGNIELTQNGTGIDISTYATATVNVSGGGSDEFGIGLVQRSLTSANIPSGTAYIGSYAFYGYNTLTSATIPDSVTSIGNYAFYSCSGLTTITIPNSVTSIGDYAFWRCSGFTSVTLPNTLTSIGNYAFGGCSGLTSLTLPDSVTSIGDGAFYDCTGLTGTLIIPEGVTRVGDSAFNASSGNVMNLTSVTLPSTLQYLGKRAFNSNYNSLIEVNYNAVNCKQTVFDSTDAPFFGCSLITTLNIGNGVVSIPAYIFYNLRGLPSVIIPSSVTNIGKQAFASCVSLASVTVLATTPPTLGSNAFQSTSASLVIYVPAESVEAYKAATNWSALASNIQAIPAS